MSRYWSKKKKRTYLTTSQKSKVKQFKGICNTSDDISATWLKKASWNVETAVDKYFSETGGKLRMKQSKQAPKLYTKYQKLNDEDDIEEEAIKGQAMVKFFEDLGVDPASVTALIICWKFKLTEAYTINKKEFLDAFSEMRIKDMKDLKSKIPSWKTSIKSKYSFKEFYRFTFEYCKPSAQAKTLPVEIAAAVWALVGPYMNYSYLSKWVKYVKEVYKKSISRDTWNQFLEFTRIVGTNWSKWSDEDAWPTVIDDYVCAHDSKKKK